MKPTLLTRFAFGLACGLLLLRAAALSAATPEEDFAARCNAAGVIKCYGFDTQGPGTDIAPGENLFPDSYGVYRGSVDTAVKVSGAGSIRFWLPSQSQLTTEGRILTQNLTGQWSMHQKGGAFAGQTFGPGSTLYVQVRFRISSGMLSNIGANSSWKWFEIINGNSVCGTEGVVFVNYYMTGLMTGYTDCGGRGLHPENDGGSNSNYRHQQGDYNCWYTDFRADSAHPGCFSLTANEWWTFQFRITIGTWNQQNSIVEVWVAKPGESVWKKWIETTPFTLAADATTDTLNNIVLTGYMTGLSTGWITPGYMWYDEMIVSRQPIQLPDVTTTSVPLPPTPEPSTPATPTNLKVQ